MELVVAAGVAALHLLFVAFMLYAPFGASRELLVLHVLLTPFLWMHWLLNDDTCALTVLECKLRGVEPSASFFHRVVSPVYKLRDEDVRVAVWVGSVALWAVSVSRVTRRDIAQALGLDMVLGG